MHTDAKWLFRERKHAVEGALLLTQARAGADVADSVMALLDRYLAVDHFSVFVKSPSQSAQLLATGNREGDGLAMAIAQVYSARYCQYDEVPNRQCAEGSPGGLIVHSRRAAEVRNSRYRLECYDLHGITERLTIGYADAGDWRLLHLYRLSKNPSFDDDDVAQALRAAACILPVLPSLASNKISRQPATELRLARFCDRLLELPVRLSEREIEVCARALMGMTVTGTALDLGLAPTSIATYRKRAYQKLNICSQTELYALLP